VYSPRTRNRKKALLTVQKQHDVFVIRKVSSADKYCIGETNMATNFFSLILKYENCQDQNRHAGERILTQWCM
jgi:hypothetical protein